MEEQKRLLAMVDILQPLPSHEVEWLARRSFVARRQPRETIEVGEERPRLLILVSGRVRVYEPDPHGQDLTLSVVEGGTIVGQTGFAIGRSQNLRVEALEPSIIRILGWDDLEDLMRRNPEVGVRLTQLSSARLAICEDRLSDLVRKEVPARLAGLVLKLSEYQGVRTRDGERKIPNPLHPPAARHHDRGQPRGRHQGAGEAETGGGVEVRDRHIHVTDTEVLGRLAESRR